jgi:hypothetical protein
MSGQRTVSPYDGMELAFLGDRRSSPIPFHGAVPIAGAALFFANTSFVFAVTHPRIHFVCAISSKPDH